MSTESEKIEILKEIFGQYICSGKEILFKCPFCMHRKYKLSFNIEKNCAKCWVCDRKTTNILTLIKYYGDNEQKNKWLQLTNQIDLEEFDSLFFLEPEQEKRALLKLPNEFISLCHKENSLTATQAINYLNSRGISKKDILYWKIGYAVDGFYRDRIIVPSFDINGRLDYFVARSYNKNRKKYLNPPYDKDIIFNRLYLDFSKPIVITEGVFDAIVAVNAVPLLGSTLKENSLLFQIIIENNTPIYIGLDSDAEKKAEKLIQDLLKYEMEIHKIDITGKKDIGEMTKEEFLEFKRNAKLIRNSDDVLINKIEAIF